MGDETQPESEVLKDLDDIALLRRASALASDLDTDDGDGDTDDGYWIVIRELHRRGTSLIFDESMRLLVSEDAACRRVACDVLGRLDRANERLPATQTCLAIARLCADESASEVLHSAISALGDLGMPEALPVIVAHAAHSDSDVTFAVACALPRIAGGEWRVARPNTPRRLHVDGTDIGRGCGRP